MSRIRTPSPAILVAVLALVAALAGTALAGTDASTSAISKKKVKKIVKKQVKKEVAKQIDNAVGPQGPPGPQGQNATRLFAYIGDQQDAEFSASVRYGRGVTAVNDPVGDSYTVTFNRSVANCVVQATVGHGDPAVTNDFAAAGAGVFVSMASAERADQVAVNFRDGVGGSFTDSSFMITAFC